LSNYINYGRLSTFDKVKELALNEDFSRSTLRELTDSQKNTRVSIGLFNILDGVDGYANSDIFFKYYELLSEVVSLIKERYGYSHITYNSLMVVKLIPNGVISTHIDESGKYGTSHRIHIPIKTNYECLFNIDGEIKHLEEGNIIEIDNMKPHSVVNGDEDRIHLIVDISESNDTEYEFDKYVISNKIPEYFYT
jgi:hypothetical protein